MSKMKILFVASEAAPFIKTGGLADVAAALPKYLKRQGAEVKLVLPLYSLIDREKYHIRKMYDGSCVKMGNCEEWYSVYYAETPCHYDAYFIEFHKYFVQCIHLYVQLNFENPKNNYVSDLNQFLKLFRKLYLKYLL